MLIRTFKKCFSGFNVRPLESSYIFIFLFQGGLGQAAATVVHLLKELNGVEACRQFYRDLLKLPAAGGSFFHGILDIELDEQTDRLPNSKLKAIFEVTAFST